jgi:uncharacterized protein (DUF1778 family)
MAVRTPGKPRRVQRLELRCDIEQKEIVQRAADLRGESLTAFVMSSVRRAAEEVIREHDVIQLAGEDARALAIALLSPPPPSRRFLRAIEDYNELMSSP